MNKKQVKLVFNCMKISKNFYIYRFKKIAQKFAKCIYITTLNTS